MALECWSGPGLSQPLLYLRWSIEVTIAPRAFDFMAHPNDSQDDAEQDTRQHEPRPGVALPGLRLVPGACSIVHFRSILPNCPPTQLRIRREGRIFSRYPRGFLRSSFPMGALLSARQS